MPLHEEIELQSVGSSKQPRTNTMEAQREIVPPLRVWHRLFSLADDNAADDLVEKHLKKLIQDLKGSVDVRRYKRLLSDYQNISARPGYEVGVSVFSCWHVKDGTIDGVAKASVDRMVVETDVDFAGFIDSVNKFLARPNLDGIRVLVFSTQPGDTSLHSLFTLWHKFTATLRGRLLNLPSAPCSILHMIVSKQLGIEEPGLPLVPEPNLFDEKRMLLVPPSYRPKPQNLDPDRLNNSQIILRWQKHPPAFVNDFNVYLWEHYKSLPPARIANIRILVTPNTIEPILVIVFNYTDSLTLFTKQENMILYSVSIGSAPGQRWSATSVALLSILTVFQVMIKESTIFVQECSIILEVMNLKVRRQPTADKFRYFVHLEDYRALADDGVVHALSVLDSLQTWIVEQETIQPLWDGGTRFTERIEVLRGDLKYLIEQLNITKKQILDARNTVKEHLEMKQNTRNFAITILAAIFLPLSFATSFFGMNINTATPSNESGFSNDTATWIGDSPSDFQNPLKALVSAIGTSGTMSFSWKSFYITAICITLTLPLSLTISNVFRRLFRFASRSTVYWRAMILLPSLAFVLCSITPVIGIFYAYLFCNGLLLGWLTFRTYKGLRLRPRQYLWLTLLLVTSGSFVADWLVPVPMMWLPWLLYLIIWIWSWHKKRRISRDEQGQSGVGEITSTSRGRVAAASSTANLSS